MRSEEQIRERIKELTQKIENGEAKLSKSDNAIINVYVSKDILEWLKEIYILQWVLEEKIRDPRPLPGKVES